MFTFLQLNSLKKISVYGLTEHFSVGLLGNLGQAELIGREALRLLPNDHTIMFSLANVLGKLQKYKVIQPC